MSEFLAATSPTTTCYDCGDEFRWIGLVVPDRCEACATAWRMATPDRERLAEFVGEAGSP